MLAVTQEKYTTTNMSTGAISVFGANGTNRDHAMGMPMLSSSMNTHNSR